MRIVVRQIEGYAGWVVVVAGVVGRSEGRDGALLVYETAEAASRDSSRVAGLVYDSRARLGNVGEGMEWPVL